MKHKNPYESNTPSGIRYISFTKIYFIECGSVAMFCSLLYLDPKVNVLKWFQQITFF